ncbi:MAG: deoxyribose-phosphate aldolase [Solirubrobacterales bacterium]
MKGEELAKYIDHTILKPEAVESEIINLCREAVEYGFASVCINPYHVKFASEILKDSKVKVCTVIGFPLGANTTEVKVFETMDALKNGADEIDMVINIGKLKEQNYDYVGTEISKIAEVVKGKGILKVIVETCLLSKDEIIKISEIVRDSGADFIKTSTGFSKDGAKVDDIKLMKSILLDTIGIKASGGIRDKETAVAMIEAGATRIGASASVKICE